MIPVRYERGVHLPTLDLWLDPWDERPTAFVSHAHTDHIGNHREVILSRATAKLMTARLPGNRVEHQLDFRVPFSFRNAELTLYPAGHIYGSAQAHIVAENQSLLYTGDFKLRKGKSAEPIEWRQADTLIMETTYGLPRYLFPPTDQVIAELVKFCAEAIEEDATPILFGYSLGKAQEILAALFGSGFRVLLHPAVFRMTRLYETLQDRLPPYSLFRREDLPGSVFICPPSANQTKLVQSIRSRRTAMLTGWALNPGANHRFQCDVAFPLSDHADYSDLLKYVELVQPKRVLTLHGYATEFAEELRRRGVEAWALGEDNQLELSVAVATPEVPGPTLFDPAVGEDCEFGRFVAVCEAISQVTGKLRKIELLSNYLRSLDQDALQAASVYLTGHPFAQTDARVLQVGWAVVRKSLMQAAAISEVEFRRISAGYGDAGRVAYEVLLGKTRPRPSSMTEVKAQFDKLEQASGPAAKTALLTEWLSRLDAARGSYVIRILSGDLRIGLKEGLVEESIAAAFAAELDQVREAHMLTGDLGETAVLALRRSLDSASVNLFRPIKSMLAIPEPAADAVAKRLSHDFPQARGLAEEKLDGIRAQLHVGRDQIRVYSRDLRDISDEFPELTHLRFSQTMVLDGEILAFGQGRKLTFFDLQRRLGRKQHPDLFVTNDIPVVYVAFDLLWLDGHTLLKEPLHRRRSMLESMQIPELVHRSNVRTVSSADEIEQAFVAARRAGNEGLMIKDPDGLYQPGSRGGSWIKLKKELATLDVVVVAAEQGHGKRSHLLSDYTFAVRNEQTQALETIGKAYSGLTDAEIEELTEYFRRTTVRLRGRLHEVLPQVVLEVAFDSVQPSTRHSSGLALRFPRIKAIRRDKTVGEIDTVEAAKQLVATSSIAF
ncbi:MAG TPA: ATP-dependent DNA ligase [Chthoniobacterales bacterium]|nr:ATP-dependent DNA ligase [Chthoniobacterales bacterium]